MASPWGQGYGSGQFKVMGPANAVGMTSIEGSLFSSEQFTVDLPELLLVRRATVVVPARCCCCELLLLALVVNTSSMVLSAGVCSRTSSEGLRFTPATTVVTVDAAAPGMSLVLSVLAQRRAMFTAAAAVDTAAGITSVAASLLLSHRRASHSFSSS